MSDELNLLAHHSSPITHHFFPITIREVRMSTYAKAETMLGATLAPLGWVKKVAVVAAFSVLLALSARVAVPLPFSPIPVTMQTFVVLLAGALLGSRLG